MANGFALGVGGRVSEDARRLYERTLAKNVAFLNRLALSCCEAILKRSLKVKRKRAGRNIGYLHNSLVLLDPASTPRARRNLGSRSLSALGSWWRRLRQKGVPGVQRQLVAKLCRSPQTGDPHESIVRRLRLLSPSLPLV